MPNSSIERQRLVAKPRADDEVDDAGAELIADAPHLRQHGVGAADDDLAGRDAVGKLAPRGALPLRHRIGAVIARLPHALGDRPVLLDKADARRQSAHVGKRLLVAVGDMGTVNLASTDRRKVR